MSRVRELLGLDWRMQADVIRCIEAARRSSCSIWDDDSGVIVQRLVATECHESVPGGRAREGADPWPRRRMLVEEMAEGGGARRRFPEQTT